MKSGPANRGFPPPLPSLSLSLPSLSSLPLPLEVGPLIAARESGSGSGRSPAAERYLVNFRLKISPLVAKNSKKKFVAKKWSGHIWTGRTADYGLVFKSYTHLHTSLCERKGQSERQLLRHQAAAKSNQRLQASPVGQLHLSARGRICSHSSSCPRLDQEEMPWFHWKKPMATEFASPRSIGLL